MSSQQYNDNKIQQINSLYVLAPLIIWLFIAPFFPLTRKLFCDYSSVLIIATAITVLLANAKNNGLYLKDKVFITTTLFFIYLYCSVFWAKGYKITSGLNAMKSLIAIIGFLFIFSSNIVIDEKLFRRIAISVVALCGIYCLINVVFQTFDIVDVALESIDGETLKKRMVGYGPMSRNPISTSAFVLTYMYIGIYVWLKNPLSIIEKSIVVASLLACLIFVYFTGSRSAYLALVIAILAVYRDKIKYLLPLILMVVAINADQLLARGLSLRPQIWWEGIKQSSEQWIVGHGQYTKFVMEIDGHKYLQTHNGFIETFYIGGIVGLALCLAMFYTSIKTVMVFNKNPENIIVRLMFISSLIFLAISGYGIATRPAEAFGEHFYFLLLPIALAIRISVASQQTMQHVAKNP